jgi:hypothetical protein
MVEQQGLAAGTVHEQLLASAGLPVAADRKEAPSSLSLSLRRGGRWVGMACCPFLPAIYQRLL